MTKKKGISIFVAVFLFFFGSIYYRNITTYISMKNHTGYTYGIIVKVWDDNGGWYSRYSYSINGKTFLGRQGEKLHLNDTVLIVYDTTAPRFSMIAAYSLRIPLDSNNKIIRLDSSIIKYKWSKYLPGDEIHSIKDIWSLD